MRYVKDHPNAKKSKWKVPAVKLVDGTIIYNSEYIPTRTRQVVDSRDPTTGRYTFKDVPNENWDDKYDGAEKIELPNMIFEASIKPTSWYAGQSFSIHYQDMDDEKVHYHTAPLGTFKMLEALSEGHHRMFQGHFRGYWTFEKRGSDLQITPYTDLVEEA